MKIMAKHSSKSKGKHPITALQGTDGWFLLVLPNPPGSPSHLALELPFQTEPEVSRTPVHPGGLVYHGSTLSDKIYTENLHPEAESDLVVGCAEGAPLHFTPPIRLPSSRASSVRILVTMLPPVPVTVEIITDKDLAVRHRSYAELTSMESGSHIQVDQVTGYLGIISNCADASMHTCNNLLSWAPISWALAPKGHSTGLEDVKCMLNKLDASTRHSRSAWNRAPSSLECDNIPHFSPISWQTSDHLQHTPVHLHASMTSPTQPPRFPMMIRHCAAIAPLTPTLVNRLSGSRRMTNACATDAHGHSPYAHFKCII